MNTANEKDRPATRRVLVIDDNVDLALSLANLLHFYNCRVDVAHNGLEGLRLALQKRYDVVFIDIGLPGMSGYEVVRILRGALDDPPLLLAQTAYGQPEDVRMSREAGFDAHLVKPVDPAEIIRHVMSSRTTANGSGPGPGPTPGRRDRQPAEGEGDASSSASRVRGSPREAPGAGTPKAGPGLGTGPVRSIVPAASIAG